MVCAKGRPKTLLAQGAEQRPVDGIDVADILLEHVIAMLSDVSHVERSKPHLVSLASSLCSEEVVTLVEPAKGIFFSIISRKG